MSACGLLRRNRARPREAGASRVHAPARRIHIRLRGAVLRESPRLRGFRPASAAKQPAHGQFWHSSRRASALAGDLGFRCRSPWRSSRALRRRLARDASSAGYVLLASHRHPDAALREPSLPVSLRSILDPRPASSPATRSVPFAPFCGVVTRRLSDVHPSIASGGSGIARESPSRNRHDFDDTR